MYKIECIVNEHVIACFESSSREESLCKIRKIKSEISDVSIVMYDTEGWNCTESDLMGEEKIIDIFKNGREIFIQDRMENEEIVSFKRNLILASSSPRRKQYLKLLNIPFDSQNPETDEKKIAKAAFDLYCDQPYSVKTVCSVMALAEKKAQSIWRTNMDSVVIGSDTTVMMDDKILGKPTSKEEALRQIKIFAGRDHYVYTGVSIFSKEKIKTFFGSAKVRFYPWREIKEFAVEYVDSKAPLDKAGGYGIQEQGALMISGIKGDFYSIVGLPVSKTYKNLKLFGF